MNLPNLFDQQNPAQVKKYLAVYINSVRIQSALWQVSGTRIELLEKSNFFGYQSLDDAVKKLDKSLQDLGPESEDVDQVVFGFDPEWIEKGDIRDDKKPFLKKLTDDLSLKPVGFVLTSEAFAQYLSESEPLFSAILVEYSSQFLSVHLIQRGLSIAYEQVGRSGDSVADLREALARCEKTIGQDYFPPKMILFSLDLDKEDLADEKTAILGFDWKSEHPFLHAPLVEIKEADFLIKAIVTQSGKAVMGSNVSMAVPDQEETLITAADGTMAEEMGFAPVTEDMPEKAIIEEGDNFHRAPELDHAIPQAEETLFSPEKENKMKSFWQKLSKRADEVSHHHSMLAGFIGGLIVLFFIGIFWSLSAVSAVVEIKLDTKIISQDTQLTLDPDATEPNAAKGILPATLTQKEMSGQQTVDTTGVKLIGDKATGKVSVINKTDEEVTFDQGTTLHSGELSFVLDGSVTIAAASIEENSDGETKKYGKTDVNVTAGQIGAESNLAQDTELQVESHDAGTYAAVVVDSFSGGASREIRVVSEDDMYSLRMDLIADLDKQAQGKFEEESGNGTYYIPSGEKTVENITFDAEEGEEVNALTAEMSLSVEAVVYEAADLKPLAQELLSSQIPDGYVLDGSDPQILSAPDEEASGSADVVLSAQVSSVVKPDINLDELRQSLVGLELSQAEAKLRDDARIKAGVVKITPEFMARFKSSLPKDATRITISVEE